jgi:uncharacterized membrane protein
MDELFQSWARAVALAIEGAAVLIVAYGALDGFWRVLLVMLRPRASLGQRKEVWRRVGMWLLLGLEFELAADIVKTVIAPSWQDLGQLAAIAVIRTFLNYFLERDLDASEERPDTQAAFSRDGS